MTNWEVAIMILLALVTGAAIPLLVQLSMTVRGLRLTMERLSTTADRALSAGTEAAEGIDRLISRVEKEGRLENFLTAIDSLSQTVNQLREATRVASAVGAAVGPAVGAAVRAWRSSNREGRTDDEHDTHTYDEEVEERGIT